jgi:hypothetical protein
LMQELETLRAQATKNAQALPAWCRIRAADYAIGSQPHCSALAEWKYYDSFV